jgi:hypothetical protein
VHDTETPMDSVPSLSPHQYSPIPRHITPDSALPCSHDTAGLVTTYMHLLGITPSVHHDVLPQTWHYYGLEIPTDSLPGHRDCAIALECHTNPAYPYPRTPTALFWLSWRTALSAELNTNDPDLMLTPCLARLYCTAFSYRAMPIQ